MPIKTPYPQLIDCGKKFPVELDENPVTSDDYAPDYRNILLAICTIVASFRISFGGGSGSSMFENSVGMTFESTSTASMNRLCNNEV